MANSSVFLVTTPDGTDDPREGDDRIREVKAAVKERMLQAGIFWESNATPDAAAGMMIPGLQGGLAGQATNTPGANDLVFFETDKATDMAIFNDSGNTLTLGTGRGGANDYSIVTETGSFADLDVNGRVTALPSKSILGTTLDTDLLTTTLTGSYQALAETITITTAANVGMILLFWVGTLEFTTAAATDDMSVDIRFLRAGSAFHTYADWATINNMPTAQLVRIPCTLIGVDTGYSASTSTAYTVEAKATLSGSGVAAVRGVSRSLILTENVWN